MMTGQRENKPRTTARFPARTWLENNPVPITSDWSDAEGADTTSVECVCADDSSRRLSDLDSKLYIL